MKLPIRKTRRPTRKQIMKTETHGEYFVWWDRITKAEWENYLDALESARREQDMQTYLERNPKILVHTVGGGHGRWVIPQFRFGSNHVADFVVGEKHSFGHEWLLVELKSPKAKMFSKKGDPTASLIHAIRQIQDWRSWIRKNIDYVGRQTAENGLGLIDINDSTSGLILIGREADNDEKNNERRRQMCIENRLSIHTYDFLLRVGSNIDVIRFIKNEIV